ncbi:hypothetical protein [Longimicrobium sp.]|uniref:hypothetical protein n=1 Tax=Longimicrobium sp. TaxID=2029185 RepID=UPI002CFEDF52|nr:hypothetical protein [Longimicrobium sp.]HSU15400.1 hypothetical protein [Longimicrobium sp.]
MSLPRYPEYKDSGIESLGHVPACWEIRRLKHVSNIFLSNVDKKTYEGEVPVKLCNYTDVYYNDVITRDLDYMPATASTAQIAKFELRRGDTIITKDSETADDIAISAYVPDDLPGVVCGYHLALVRSLPGVSGRYLKWLFDSNYVKSKFAVLANGLTRVGLSHYALVNVELPIATSAEQELIAGFLDRETAKIDTLMKVQRRLIDRLTEKRHAVISHAVTKGLDPHVRMKTSGIEWLGDVPAHWTLPTLRRVIQRIEQGWSPDCDNRQADPDEWGVVKAGCVNRGVFIDSENKALPENLSPIVDYEIRPGDVLMSRASGSPALVGSTAFVAVVRPRLMLSDKIFRIHVEKSVDPRYFVAAFNGHAMRTQVERAISGADGLANNLPKASLMDFRFPVPPLKEQESIIEHLIHRTGQMDSLIKEAERAIALLQERRTALISAAVTGKIDVRGLAEAA